MRYRSVIIKAGGCALASAIALALGACDPDGSGGGFSGSIDAVDQPAEWAPANIVLSDPQVFSRAEQHNDRQRELAFVRRLLDASESQKFEPQIQRDIRTLAITTAQLGISFDPVLRDNFRRESRIADLENQVNERRLRAELLRLDALIAQLEQQAASEVKLPKDGPATLDSSIETPKGAPSAEVGALVTAIKDKLTELSADISGEGRVAATDVPASPEDRFRDLQAYRTMLRAYEASVSLDDTHDLDGNTLYRVQFQATILPDEIRGRFGAIRITPKAGELSPNEVADLYWRLGAHLTERLNPRGPQDVNLGGNATAEILTGVGDLYGTVTMPGINGRADLRIAVPPGQVGLYQGAIDNMEGLLAPANQGKKLRRGIDDLRSVTDHDLESGSACPTPNHTLKNLFASRDELAKTYLANFPAYAGILRAVNDLAHQGLIDRDPAEIERLTADYAPVAGIARQYRDARIASLERQLEAAKGETGTGNAQVTARLAQAVTDCQAYFDVAAGEASPIPPRFTEFVNAGRGVRVTSVSPSEQAQRISTLASAAASVQTALSIAASIPNTGVGVNAGLGNLQNEVGKLESRERNALIIGYMEAAAAGNASFGWVFGPPVTADVDKKKLVHRQREKNHDVQVELSVPAWWPRIELVVRSGWAGHWEKADESDGLGENCESGNAESQTCKETSITVELQDAAADLEALSDHLVTMTVPSFPIPSRAPRIHEVTPNVIEQGTGRPVTLVVRGAGLWRSGKVYVYGVPQTDVQLLPDLGGLSVTVDPSLLRNPPQGSNMAKLAIFTSKGSTRFDALELIEARRADPDAIAVRAVLPYHVNNTDFSLRTASGSFPVGAVKTLVFRPLVAGQDYKGKEANAALTASQSVATATLNWPSGGVNMQSGDNLGVRYVYQTDVSLAPVWSEEASVVYYAAADDAQATLSGPDVAKDTSQAVTLTIALPVRARTSFPLLFDPGTDLSVTSANNPDARAVISGKEGDSFQVTLSPAPGKQFVAGTVGVAFKNNKAATGTLPAITGTVTVK